MIKELYYLSGGIAAKEDFKSGDYFDNPDGTFIVNEKKAIKEFERRKIDKYLKKYNFNNSKVEFTFLNKLTIEIEEQDFNNKCFDFIKILKIETIKSYLQDNNGEVLLANIQ